MHTEICLFIRAVKKSDQSSYCILPRSWAFFPDLLTKHLGSQNCWSLSIFCFTQLCKLQRLSCENSRRSAVSKILRSANLHQHSCHDGHSSQFSHYFIVWHKLFCCCQLISWLDKKNVKVFLIADHECIVNIDLQAVRHGLSVLDKVFTNLFYFAWFVPPELCWLKKLILILWSHRSWYMM